MGKFNGALAVAAGLALTLTGAAQSPKQGPPRATSPDQRSLATATDKAIHIYDAATQRKLRTFLGHGGAVTALAFSPDGKLLASGSRDQTVALWDVGSGRELLRLRAGAAVARVAFSPDGRQVTAGDAAMTTHTWDVASGQEVRTEKK